MTQLPPDFLKTMGFDIENPRDQLLVRQSVMEHTRNGRGFWPVIDIDGMPQVLRFSTHPSSVECHESHDDRRWTPETGLIDLVPLHSLRVADWPRVRLVA